MDKRPVLILRNSHIGLNSRIWNWKHFALGNSIYCVATDSTNLLPLCYEQHVVGSQELDETYTENVKPIVCKWHQ